MHNVAVLDPADGKLGELPGFGKHQANLVERIFNGSPGTQDPGGLVDGRQLLQALPGDVPPLLSLDAVEISFDETRNIDDQAPLLHKEWPFIF
jgi:hypothetical protein